MVHNANCESMGYPAVFIKCFVLIIRLILDEINLMFGNYFQSSVKLDELKKVENEVNKIVNDDDEVYAACATLEDAKKITGLRAMFCEVYIFFIIIIFILITSSGLRR